MKASDVTIVWKILGSIESMHRIMKNKNSLKKKILLVSSNQYEFHGLNCYQFYEQSELFRLPEMNYFVTIKIKIATI